MCLQHTEGLAPMSPWSHLVLRVGESKLSQSFPALVKYSAGSSAPPLIWGSTASGRVVSTGSWHLLTTSSAELPGQSSP